MMSKKVTEAKKNEVSTYVYKPVETVIASDITIPRLRLMQGLSGFVGDGKAAVGELRRSTNCELLGWVGTEKKDVQPVEFVPLTFINQWVVQCSREGKVHHQKAKFVKFELRTAANDDLDWEWEDKATDRTLKRVKIIEVFALLVGDMEKAAKAEAEFKKTKTLPDLDDTLLPVVITFKGPKTYAAGQAIVTQFTKAKSLGVKYGTTIKPHSYKMLLTPYSFENDKGKFFVMDVQTKGKISDDQLKLSDEWCQTLRTASVKVDEFEEDSGASTPQDKGQNLSDTEAF